MVIRTLAMAVSSLVLAGCVSVGPNYKAPVQEPVVLQGAQQQVVQIERVAAGAALQALARRMQLGQAAAEGLSDLDQSALFKSLQSRQLKADGDASSRP